MQLSHEKRQLLQDELARLYKLHGKLAPDILVEEAANPNHPLHDGFGWEWNDERAAHLQRLDHARRLISSVKYEVIHERKILAVPVYIHDPRAEGQGYVELKAIKNEKAVALDALKTEISRSLRYIERAQGIAGELELDAELRERLRVAGVYLEEVTNLASVA
jgi:hypothetical protein